MGLPILHLSGCNLIYEVFDFTSQSRKFSLNIPICIDTCSRHPSIELVVNNFNGKVLMLVQ